MMTWNKDLRDTNTPKHPLDNPHQHLKLKRNKQTNSSRASPSWHKNHQTYIHIAIRFEAQCNPLRIKPSISLTILLRTRNDYIVYLLLQGRIVFIVLNLEVLLFKFQHLRFLYSPMIEDDLDPVVSDGETVPSASVNTFFEAVSRYPMIRCYSESITNLSFYQFGRRAFSGDCNSFCL